MRRVVPSFRSKGYSLVEMLAALAIFGAGVLAAMELFAVCLQSTSDSLDYTRAVFLAQSLVEETIAEGASFTTSDSGNFGGNFPRHSWELEIEETDSPGLMMVHAVVTWTERGIEKQYELTTLVADRIAGGLLYE